MIENGTVDYNMTASFDFSAYKHCNMRQIASIQIVIMLVVRILYLIYY